MGAWVLQRYYRGLRRQALYDIEVDEAALLQSEAAHRRPAVCTSLLWMLHRTVCVQYIHTQFLLLLLLLLQTNVYRSRHTIPVCRLIVDLLYTALWLCT